MKKDKVFKEIGVAFLPFVIAATMLTGCGSASYDSISNMSLRSNAMTESAAVVDDVYSYDSYTEEAGATTASDIAIQDTSRKLIKTVDMSVETDSFDELLTNVQNRITSLGGYIESSNVYNSNRYFVYGDSDSRSRTADLMIRIPASNLNEFLSLVSDQSNITRKSESVEDVTLEYVDMDSHKKTLQAEQDRLMELMDKAESIEDLITIESRLSDIRYQIESMESQLRTFDNQVTYSTVYLGIEEVKVYTQVEELSRFEEMTQGFVDSFESIGNGILDFGVSFVIRIPYMLLGAVIVLLIVLIIFLLRRRSVKKLERQWRSTKSPVSEEQK